MNKIALFFASVRIYIYIIILACSSLAYGTTKEYVDCQKVQILCKDLYTIIKNDNYQPDLLIGLARGGLQPLSYLAGEKQLNLRNVATIALTSYEGMEQRNIKIIMPLHIEDYKKYKSILIVDDLIDSGKTIEYIKTLFENELPDSEIKVAVLYYKPTKSKIKPDYYVEETDKWLVFPWED